MHHSTIQERGLVTFPEFTGERVYMEPIHRGRLPARLGRWAATIEGMLVGMTIPEIMYLMIDQQALQAGQFQRRPGIHVDGYWVGMHTGGGEPRHGADPEEPKKEPVPFEHAPFPTRHGSDSASWGSATFERPEALLLASNVEASRAYTGLCMSGIGEGGDCAYAHVSGVAVVPLAAHRCYKGNVGTIHESLPAPYACKRTLVRLNIPNVN